MTRRNFMGVMGLFTSVSLLPGLGQAQKKSGKPNVILILTDDQGYGDTGVHGNDTINTPNIDRLVTKGCELTRFYVEPVCAPTRACLMTGRYYYRTGVIHTSRGGAKMSGEERTVAELLQHNGYQTGIFGKWHLGDNYPMRPQDQGFEETMVHRGGGIGQTPDQPNSYFDPLLWKNGEQYQGKGYCTDIFFDAALDFISDNRDQPFFIYLPTNTPHTPLEVSDEYADPYRAQGLPEATAKVYGMIKNIDDNVERLVSHLQRLNITENTLIIYISDNGANTDRYNAGLRRRKSSNYEGGIRALAFFQWAGCWDQGRTVDRIAAHVDILPTILDVCGVQNPPDLHLDGVSLVPLLSDDISEEGWPDRTLFMQCHRGLTPQQYQNCAAVSQRYKMVGYPGTFNEGTFELSLENPHLELYDIKNDPGETNDLAQQSPEILMKLQEEYDAWFQEVKSTRDFTPGVIVLGSDEENPATLCRYQDSDYHLGVPHGWPVCIVQSGQYHVDINRDRFTGPGSLAVKWKGDEQRVALQSGHSSGTFELGAGEGRLEIWFELEDIGRITFSDNGTIGDVEVRRL